MSRPLDGVFVVVTRPRRQSQALIDRLINIGATPIEFPVIETVEPDDGGALLQSALTRIGRYDWLIVTSANSVDQIADHVSAFNGQVAAIGKGTAGALSEIGVAVDLMPENFVAESLLEMFPDGDGRVLMPQAAAARDVLPEGLRAKGWTVDVVAAYQTVEVMPSAEAIQQVEMKADVVTFTSSSTVTAFLATGVRMPRTVACIGPVTAKTAQEAGITVDVVAEEHTVAGLVAAIGDTFADDLG